MQICYGSTLFFCNLSEPELTGYPNLFEMLFNEKYLENSDLIIPFRRCSFGTPVNDCPFAKYWNSVETGEDADPILSLSEEELEVLRTFHRKCILEQVKLKQADYCFE